MLTLANIKPIKVYMGYAFNKVDKWYCFYCPNPKCGRQVQGTDCEYCNQKIDWSK